MQFLLGTSAASQLRFFMGTEPSGCLKTKLPSTGRFFDSIGTLLNIQSVTDREPKYNLPAAMINDRRNIKRIILEKSLELFTKCGINAVSTDDVSRHSGISKRTLYVHFKSKSQLIFDVVLFQIHLVKSHFLRIHMEHSDAIDEFFALWNYSRGLVIGVNPNFFRDLKRHYPVSGQEVIHFSSEIIEDFLIANLKRGIAQGVFREDIDVPVISVLWLRIMIMDWKELKSDSEISRHFLRGLLTQKGQLTPGHHRVENNLV